MGLILRFAGAAGFARIALIALAILALAWAWAQHHRAASLSADLSAARNVIARMEAEAAIRGAMSNAVENVGRLDVVGVTDFLRSRAGR